MGCPARNLIVAEIECDVEDLTLAIGQQRTDIVRVLRVRPDSFDLHADAKRDVRQRLLEVVVRLADHDNLETAVRRGLDREVEEHLMLAGEFDEPRNLRRWARVDEDQSAVFVAIRDAESEDIHPLLDELTGVLEVAGHTTQENDRPVLQDVEVVDAFPLQDGVALE